MLGVIAEASLKVLPRPRAQRTLRLEMPQQRALDSLNAWAGQPLPLTGSVWHDDTLTLRLEGSQSGVDAAARELGGAQAESDDASFWAAIREHTAPFFSGAEPLWRLSLPSVAPPLGLPGRQLIEWGGAL